MTTQGLASDGRKTLRQLAEEELRTARHRTVRRHRRPYTAGHPGENPEIAADPWVEELDCGHPTQRKKAAWLRPVGATMVCTYCEDAAMKKLRELRRR